MALGRLTTARAIDSLHYVTFKQIQEGVAKLSEEIKYKEDSSCRDEHVYF